MRRIFTLLTALVMVFGSTVPAQALLIDRGGGLIYDDDFDITWLQNANYAQTSGYDADGKMNWDQAMTWADTLSYYDSVRDYTYTDWRLPTALNQDGSGPGQGFVSGSEMGHLYYTELGNSAWAFTNTGPFNNLGPYSYWSGTEWRSDAAWGFTFQHGIQDPRYKQDNYCAWAVRDGNVVPEPCSLALLSLGGLALMRKCRAK